MDRTWCPVDKVNFFKFMNYIRPSIIHSWIHNTDKNSTGLNGTWLKAC